MRASSHYYTRSQPENVTSIKLPCYKHLHIATSIGQRWITLALGLFGLVNAHGMRVCLSIAITEMALPHNATVTVNSDENCGVSPSQNSTQLGTVKISNATRYNWDEHTQGLILSSFYWGYLFTSMASGVICQKLGGKHALGVGILVTAIFTLLIPVCTNWGGATALIILRVAMGLGEGMTYPALTQLLAHWIPEDERSTAGTIVFSGGPFGNVYGMLISGAILQHSEDSWPTVFYFFGIFGIISFLLITAFCYSRPSDNPYISHDELTYLENKIKHMHKNTPPTPWRYILKSSAVWASFVMKFGCAWIFLTIAADMPKYMSSVLKFSALNNGLYSSMPHMSMWVGATLTCWIADKAIKEKTMSITTVRKIGCVVSLLGPAIFLVATSYAGCNGFLAVALQIAGMTFMGCSFFSVLINVLDLSPNYASALMGLGNGIAVVAGSLAPYGIGLLTPNQTISEWRLVFWIVFGIAAISTFIYLIYGSGKVQEWNDPAFLNEKPVVDKKEIKEGLHLLPVNKQ